MKIENLSEIADFLAKNPVQILSTSRARNGEFVPVSRPFGSAMLFENKIWYCMNTNKPTFDDLSANPNVCICACNADRSWIRIHAKVVFENNLAIKQEYINRGIGRFESPKDPQFGVFYLDEIYAEIHKNGDVKIIS